MKLILTTGVAFFLLLIQLSAHPGGHYHEKDLSSLHHWNVNSKGEKAIGNFMMFKDDFIFIEGLNGSISKIPYSSLRDNDKIYADNEINKINQFNSNNFQQTKLEINYSQLIIFILSIISSFFFLAIGLKLNKNKSSLIPRVSFSLLTFLFLGISIIACKKSNVISTTTPSNDIPRTTTTFIDSAFAPYSSTITTSWDSTYFHVSCNGLPSHNMMIGITNWQQQVPIPQNYTGSNSWSIPLQPVYATTPMSTRTNFMKGAVAIAVNGIPIFNALNNRGEDSYLIGELDNWGGHCGKGDDYHYHAAPLHLSGTSGLLPIAFALDGFAVYGSKEPNGSTMATLDSCHGHIGANGVYHYHGTTVYPYVIGSMKGKVNTDPTTPAPENQILPQAFASPLRPATSPLRNASITDFSLTSPNHYLLTYKIANKFGYVEYSWNASNLYTFILTDTAGSIITNNYPR